MVPNRPTPKESGSFARAEACAIVLDHLIDQLDQPGRFGTSARRQIVAKQSRELRARFTLWSSKGPDARLDARDRQADMDTYLKLVGAALQLGARLPSGRVSLKP